jgi:negative regulator of sigma E activity
LWRQDSGNFAGGERNFGRQTVFIFRMDKEPIQDELRGWLARLPDAPMASNFTARVMQAIDLEESVARRRQPLFSRSWRTFLPRAAAAAIAVSVAGLTLQHYRLDAHRSELAKNVALVADTPMPSVEVLTNFDAIQRMSQPAQPDEELLALLK